MKNKPTHNSLFSLICALIFRRLVVSRVPVSGKEKTHDLAVLFKQTDDDTMIPSTCSRNFFCCCCWVSTNYRDATHGGWWHGPIKCRVHFDESTYLWFYSLFFNLMTSGLLPTSLHCRPLTWNNPRRYTHREIIKGRQIRKARWRKEKRHEIFFLHRKWREVEENIPKRVFFSGGLIRCQLELVRWKRFLISFLVKLFISFVSFSGKCDVWDDDNDSLFSTVIIKYLEALTSCYLNL